MPSKNDRVWITAREAARRLGIANTSMPRYAEMTGIRRRVLEGIWTTYHASDVDALVARIVIVGSGIEAEGVAP